MKLHELDKLTKISQKSGFKAYKEIQMALIAK